MPRDGSKALRPQAPTRGAAGGGRVARRPHAAVRNVSVLWAIRSATVWRGTRLASHSQRATWGSFQWAWRGARAWSPTGARTRRGGWGRGGRGAVVAAEGGGGGGPG